MARAGGSLRPWARRLHTPCSPAQPRPPGGHREPRGARSQPQRGRGGSPWATSLQGSTGGAQRTGWGTGTRGGRGSPKRCSSPLLHPAPTSMLSSCGGRGVGRGADQGGVKPGAAGQPQKPCQHSPGQPPCPWQSAARPQGLKPMTLERARPLPAGRVTAPCHVLSLAHHRRPDTEETPF